ncbi:Diphthamide biosynthesis protein 3 [Leucoagaricus sp. SymC.cos]|nr:Diphthamide biosynthesis protein 3 [Leucoagaricus sp. SymC.cos]
MGAYYDEIEIEDMTWDPEKRVYHYPCPCGDRFEISRKQLAKYEDIATCPSCSLIIRVIYDPLDYEDYEEEDEEEGSGEESEDKEGDASGSDDDYFEDALENLHIGHEVTPVISATA